MFSLPNWLRRVSGRKCYRCGTRVRRYVIVSDRTWCEPCTQREPQRFLEELRTSRSFETQDDTLVIAPHAAQMTKTDYERLALAFQSAVIAAVRMVKLPREGEGTYPLGPDGL